MTKKEEYIDKLSAQLKDWAAGIDELETKAAGVSADLKAGYEIRIKELKEKKEALSLKIKELKTSTQSAWDAMKPGIDAAKKELKDAIAAARDKFKKAA